MDSPHVPLLRRSTAVFILSGYLALAAVPQIGPAVLIIPLLVLPFSKIGEHLDATYKSYGVISRAITVAYFCFLPLSLTKLDLLPTVVILVMYIQCYTLIHVKEIRNYYHLFLMSLFLLLAACVLTPDPIIGLILLIYIVSAIWANMALRIVMEELACTAPSEVELVSLDYMLHHAYRDQPKARDSSMPVVAAGLSTAAIFITALWFFLTPRIEAGMLGRGQVENQVVGISDSVDLTAGGLISEDQTPVMMVQLPDEPDGQIDNPNLLYWRVCAYNVYGQNRWESKPVQLLAPGIRALTSGQRGDDGNVRRVERFMQQNSRVVHQTIYVDDVPRRGLPVLDLVQHVKVEDKAKGVELSWGRDNDFSVRQNKNASRRLNYEAWSEVGDPSAEALRRIPEDFDSLESADRAILLDCPLSDASKQLAARIASTETTLYDRVVAIEKFLSGPDFLYSLEDTSTEARSVIDDFIVNTRTGHCEKFATAMALLLRSQGIPTRVVSGFRGGEWSASDRTYTIRANMAHLWVEVWFPTVGWVTFDPSPRADDAPGSRLDRMAMLASRVLLKAKMFWFREVVGFDRAAQVERLQNFSLGLVQGFRGRGDGTEGFRVTGALGMLGFITPLAVLALLLVVGVMFVIRVRWIPVPRNLILTRDQFQMVRLYLLLRRQLQKHGVICSGKTAEELRRELESPRWENTDVAISVIALYNAVRFGNGPVDGSNFALMRKGILALRPKEEA